MKLVIIAGGKGSRLNLKNIPKPMVKIEGKPVLQHQVELAKKHGMEEVHILSGHLAETIVNFFSDGGKFGIKINHLTEPSPLGTAGCLKQLKNDIQKKERFLVFSGDIMLNFDIKNLINFDAQHQSLATIFVQQSSHPHDSDLLRIDSGNRVIPFSINHRGRGVYKKMAVASVGIFSGKILDFIPRNRPSDLWKEILPKLIKSNEKIMAYESSEYVEDMGTPKRLRKVRSDFKTGRIFHG